MNSLRLVDGSGVGAEWCVLGLVEVNRVGAEWCAALILVPFSCLWGHLVCSACMPAKSRLPAVEAERLEIREVNRDSRFV